MVKKIILTSIVTILAIGLVVGIVFREPIMFVYTAWREPIQKQKILLYRVDHKELESELRRFASVQRWDEPEKKVEPDFYYGDDARLPLLLKKIEPSWVQINDDRIDVGFGDAVFDKSRSFGISVWRDGVNGWGTKRLHEGMWFYSDDNRVPSRFGLPW